MQIGNKLFPYPTINNSKNASCFQRHIHLKVLIIMMDKTIFWKMLV